MISSRRNVQPHHDAPPPVIDAGVIPKYAYYSALSYGKFCNLRRVLISLEFCSRFPLFYRFKLIRIY